MGHLFEKKKKKKKGMRVVHLLLTLALLNRITISSLGFTDFNHFIKFSFLSGVWENVEHSDDKFPKYSGIYTSMAKEM